MIVLDKFDIIKILNFNSRHISYPINHIACKMTFRSGSISFKINNKQKP